MSRVRGQIWSVWVLLLASLVPTLAQQRARSIEFSEPRSEVTATNLESTRKPLRNLSNPAKKPYDVLNRGDVFSGAPLETPEIPGQFNQRSSKRAREMKKKLERERDWAFMTEEELGGQQSVEEMLHIDEYDENGVLKSKKTRLEAFLERNQKAREGNNTNRVSATRDAKGELTANTDSALDTERRSVFAAAQDAEIKRAPVAETSRSDFARSIAPEPPPTVEKRFADFFGFASPTPEKFERSAASEARLQEFKDKVIEYRAPSSVFTAPAPAASAPAFSAGAFGNSAFTPPPPAAPAGFSTFSPPAASSYGSPAFSQPPAPAPTPSYRPIPAPSFEPPRRKF